MRGVRAGSNRIDGRYIPAQTIRSRPTRRPCAACSSLPSKYLNLNQLPCQAERLAQNTGSQIYRTNYNPNETYSMSLVGTARCPTPGWIIGYRLLITSAIATSLVRIMQEAYAKQRTDCDCLCARVVANRLSAKLPPAWCSVLVLCMSKLMSNVTD